METQLRDLQHRATCDPDDYEIWVRLANLHLKLDRHAPAIRCLDLATHANPDKILITRLFRLCESTGWTYNGKTITEWVSELRSHDPSDQVALNILRMGYRTLPALEVKAHHEELEWRRSVLSIFLAMIEYGYDLTASRPVLLAYLRDHSAQIRMLAYHSLERVLGKELDLLSPEAFERAARRRAGTQRQLNPRRASSERRDDLSCGAPRPC